MKEDFLQISRGRGFLHQCTDEAGLGALLREGGRPVPAYIGFDCTAPSLHAGSLMQIMLLRLYQKSGQKPIVLLGGGTTKVGDPSGKDESRKLLSQEQIEANKEGIRKVFAQYLEMEERFDPASSNAFMVDNADWLDGLKYIAFLRDYGRHFSVNKMLSMDSVKLRLEREQHLSFLEFNYMVVQAYDFVELYKLYGCRLQFGGSDQWGNIVQGIELQQHVTAAAGKAREGALFGMTTPLLTSASGAKMGKTAAGAVWLDAEMLPVYDYWQYWRNTDDADVGRFLRLFTELPLAEIARLEKLPGAEINDAKKILATEATALCHGRKAAAEAAETARKTFEQGQAAAGLPTVTLARDRLEKGVPVIDLLHEAGLAESKGEARRLIRGGGARVNDQPLQDENATVSLAEAEKDGVIKLSAGKKRHALVKVG